MMNNDSNFFICKYCGDTIEKGFFDWIQTKQAKEVAKETGIDLPSISTIEFVKKVRICPECLSTTLKAGLMIIKEVKEFEKEHSFKNEK